MQNTKKTFSLRSTDLLRDVIVIITVAISVFLLLSFITYHTSDPGWSRTGATKEVANLGGFAGAWLADVLFCMFGWVAYVLPFLLTYAAFLSFKSYGHVVLKCLAMLLILFASSALAAIYFAPYYLPAGAGGIIGSVISGNMIQVFNVFGSALILFALLLTGIALFTVISWVKVIDALGRLTLMGLALLWLLISKLVKLIWHERPDEPSPEMNITSRPKPKIKPMPVKTQEAPILELLPSNATYSGGRKPSLDLLDLPDDSKKVVQSQAELESMSHLVESKLRDFGVAVKVVAVHPGPVITRYELDLAAGTKASKISNIATDLARSLSVSRARVVEVISGKSVIGLELPNEQREIVRLREILASKAYRNAHAPLALALGKDISGNAVVVDLAKMPHLLVAGTTGSGKSVGLNAIILSLLFKYSPQQVRLLMIDPKMLELSVYKGIPHLLTPVVTDMKDAANALRWCVAEMERRYKLMSSLGVRNLTGCNSKIRDDKKKGAPLLDPLTKGEPEIQAEELQELPYIVVLADEFADMIMVAGKKVEELIARIAQKARAAGIHLVLATQRPSVDVITGLIKANIPSRIAFQVSSRIDSRTVLDQMGAEQLLGNGDMLYLPPGTVIPVRVHGEFVSDDEVHRVAKFLRQQGKPNYIEEVLQSSEDAIPGVDASGFDDAEQDPLYDQAVEFIIHARKVSISSVQRRFKIGYNRAARIVEGMEAAGIVSPMESNGSREILVPTREN